MLVFIFIFVIKNEDSSNRRLKGHVECFLGQIQNSLLVKKKISIEKKMSLLSATSDKTELNKH